MSKKKVSVSLDEKLARLEKLREWFSGKDFKLELASEKYKEAAKLATEIEKAAEKMENEVEIISG